MPPPTITSKPSIEYFYTVRKSKNSCLTFLYSKTLYYKVTCNSGIISLYWIKGSRGLLIPFSQNYKETPFLVSLLDYVSYWLMSKIPRLWQFWYRFRDVKRLRALIHKRTTFLLVMWSFIFSVVQLIHRGISI